MPTLSPGILGSSSIHLCDVLQTDDVGIYLYATGHWYLATLPVNQDTLFCLLKADPVECNWVMNPVRRSYYLGALGFGATV